MVIVEYYDVIEIVICIFLYFVVFIVDLDRYSFIFVDFFICVDVFDFFLLEWFCFLLFCVRWSVICKLSFGNVFIFMLIYGFCFVEFFMLIDFDY